MTDDDVLLRLPDEMRDRFKDPLGPISTDPEEILDALTGPLIAVGDVVTYHFERVGRSPDVAIVDWQTKRESVDEEVERVIEASDATTVHATNPPGTLTRSVVVAIGKALDRRGPVRVIVNGEEDLSAVPAILLAPNGASVVYGQPDRGMVHVEVSAGTKARAGELLSAFEGDEAALWDLIEG